jgi:hypothetical protein
MNESEILKKIQELAKGPMNNATMEELQDTIEKWRRKYKKGVVTSDVAEDVKKDTV